MFSRAHLLIEREFEKLAQQKLWGIEAYPLKEDNMFEWTAKILGLRDTAWHGGVFRLYIKFDENFSSQPPQVCFHTIPFHPNVDMITGKPCIDFLDDWSQWKEKYSVTFLLLTIQSMLSNPVLENAINSEAVSMLIYSPHSYKQMVHDCVSASQRVEAGLMPHTVDDKRVTIVETKSKEDLTQRTKLETENTAPKRSAKISFEDYHTTWSGIATSKPSLGCKNPLLETLKENPTLQSIHYGIPIGELQAQMEQQLNEHSQLVYGKFQDKTNKPTENEIKDAKLEKINQMRKIYLQPTTTPRRTPITLTDRTRENTKVDEPWEQEVDDLVAWTNKLDAETL